MIFKVRPLIIEQVRLENGKIDKNGALFSSNIVKRRLFNIFFFVVNTKGNYKFMI